MGSLELMDAVSVQDIYVTGALFEDAGDGQMRVVRFVRHNGVIVPIFSYVTPAIAMIRDGTAAVEFARNLLKEQVAGSH
jgi:hypothetical protein